MLLFDTFRDTIFLKEDSDLQKQYDALVRLKEEYPNSCAIEDSLYRVKKGIDGEKEIAYRLKKSNIGMYVLHDINIEYGDLKAQIDYVIITKANCYFIECKNLVGNITVTDKGDFIREYTYKGRKIRKGMPSPIRQVEDQREVFKKIWRDTPGEDKLVLFFRKTIWEKYFTQLYRILAVAANEDTIIDTRYAPSDIKYKVIRSDRLINQIQYDIDHSDRSYWEGEKAIKRHAERFLELNHEKNIDYYEYYKEKCLKEDDISIEPTPRVSLRDELIEFRKKKSTSLNIPLGYIFTDEELEKLLESMPKTKEDLKSILFPDKKIELHGDEILMIINKE